MHTFPDHISLYHIILYVHTHTHIYIYLLYQRTYTFKYLSLYYSKFLSPYYLIYSHGNILIWSNICCYFVFAFPLRKTHYIIRDSWKSWYVAYSKLLGFWISSPSASKFWICWRPPLQTCQTPASGHLLFFVVLC